MSNHENLNPTMENTHDHQRKFNEEWAQSQGNAYIKRLQANYPIFETLEQQQEFAQAFNHEAGVPCTLKCSDGRVDDGGKIPGDETIKTAGSNALFSKARRAAFGEKYKGRIKAVTSHESCGAAALKFQEMVEKGEALPKGVTTSDELGVYLAKEQAKELGAEYYHINQKDLVCAEHNERLLVLDGTDYRFNANKIKDFPPRFSSTALGLGESSDYVKNEAEVLSGIALSDHGFGQRFTAANPFYIIIIGRNQTQLDETKELLAPLAEKMIGRVKIQGLLAPQEEK